ncbi:MAG: outer membrane protein transport protein [Ignavibacteriales bacterium]|nr:outer membrane protein transport protein [Ignavibacteriales bacterium]
MRISILGLLLAGVASTGSAQFAEDVLRFSQFGLGVGGRTLGMGTASVGVADDYSALFWNPAGLAQMRNYEFSAGISYHGYNNSTQFLGSKTASSDDVINLNNLGIVYPVPTVRGSLTFAFGFNRVANYTTNAEFSGYNSASSIIPTLMPDVNLYAMSQSELKDFLDNNIPYQLFLADTANGRLVTNLLGNVEQSVRVREGGGMNHWSFGGALDVAKDFSLGASVSVVSGSYSYIREYQESDVNNVYQKSPGDTFGEFDHFRLTSTINSSITGFNALFGLMYRKQGLYRIGFTVRTPTYYTIDETFSDEARSRFDPNEVPPASTLIDEYDIAFDGRTEYKVITPLKLTLGASLQLRDWLVLSGDAEYTDWREMKFDTPNADLESENRLIQTLYRPTVNLRGGAEVTLWEYGVKLRGGIALNPSPYEGDPPEFNQFYYTAGAGLQLDKDVWLNAGYALGNWKTFRDNYFGGSFPPSRTSENITTNSVNVTLSVRF